MPISTRRTALVLAAAAALVGTPRTSAAQPGSAFPSRPVRIVVPFPPGQASDTFARLMAEKLAARWPQPVVVENKPGAGGAVAVESVVRGAADGYTLLWGGTGVTVLPAVCPPIPARSAGSATATVRTRPCPSGSSAPCPRCR